MQQPIIKVNNSIVLNQQVSQYDEYVVLTYKDVPVNYQLLDSDGTTRVLQDDIYDTTDYIKIDHNFKFLKINTLFVLTLSGFNGGCLYDSNKNFLARFGSNPTLNGVIIDLTQYPNAEYFRVSFAARGADGKEINDCFKVSYLNPSMYFPNESFTSIVYVGQNEQFTTIDAALNFISGRKKSYSKRYTIIVKEGTYYISSTINVIGYVNIIGVNKALCKLIMNLSSRDAYKNIFDVNTSEFRYSYCEIANFTCITDKAKGTFHLDSPDWTGEIYIHDIIAWSKESESSLYLGNSDLTKNLDSTTGQFNFGIHDCLTIRVENIMCNGYIWSHTNTSRADSHLHSQSNFIVKNCTCLYIRASFMDDFDSFRNVIIENNGCNFIWFTMNPANGKITFRNLKISGNKCKYIAENRGDTFISDVFGSYMFYEPTLHRYVLNNTNTILNRGDKVVFTNEWRTVQKASGNEYDAVVCYPIAIGDFGVVQYGGDKEAFYNYLHSSHT